MNVLRRRKPLAEIGTDNVLVPDFRTECCTSDQGFNPVIEVYSENIGPVMIERNFVRIAPEKFEAVPAVVLINLRTELDKAIGTCGNGHE